MNFKKVGIILLEVKPNFSWIKVAQIELHSTLAPRSAWMLLKCLLHTAP